MIIKIKYKGKYYNTLIDDEDYEICSGLYLQLNKQHNNKLRVKCIYWKNGKRIIDTYLHRFILNVSKGIQIDHINGNCLDNRRFNLRLCNNIENNQNRKIDKRNSSGYKGVYFDKIRKKWVAEIKVNKCKKFIGRFINKEEAAIAYNKFAKKYFKKFAVLNDIK